MQTDLIFQPNILNMQLLLLNTNFYNNNKSFTVGAYVIFEFVEEYACDSASFLDGYLPAHHQIHPLPCCHCQTYSHTLHLSIDSKLRLSTTAAKHVSFSFQATCLSNNAHHKYILISINKQNAPKKIKLIRFSTSIPMFL